MIRGVLYSDKRQKSYDCFLDDLKRCEQLGLTLYNFQYNLSINAVQDPR